jgi:hypothetical protein
MGLQDGQESLLAYFPYFEQKLKEAYGITMLYACL